MKLRAASNSWWFVFWRLRYEKSHAETRLCQENAQTDRQKQIVQGRSGKRSISNAHSRLAIRHKLLLVGRRRYRRFLVLVDDAEVWLPRTELVALCQLAAARLADTGPVVLLRMTVSRLRELIDRQTGLDGLGDDLIFATGKAPSALGKYLLSVPPGAISIDELFREVLLTSMLDSATAQILLSALKA